MTQHQNLVVAQTPIRKDSEIYLRALVEKVEQEIDCGRGTEAQLEEAARAYDELERIETRRQESVAAEELAAKKSDEALVAAVKKAEEAAMKAKEQADKDKMSKEEAQKAFYEKCRREAVVSLRAVGAEKLALAVEGSSELPLDEAMFLLQEAEKSAWSSASHPFWKMRVGIRSALYAALSFQKEQSFWKDKSRRAKNGGAFGCNGR